MNDSRRRVLFLCTGLNQGGAETQVLNLGRELRHRGWGVHVISMLATGQMIERFAAERIPVYTLGMRRGVPSLAAILRFWKLVNQIKPAIVHSHMVHANLFARVLRFICPIPHLICTSHSMIEGSRWREVAYRVTDRLCDATTIISAAAARRFLQVRAVPPERLLVIPNGVELDKFEPNCEARERTRLELGVGQQFAWLVVARLEPVKDHAGILRAFRELVSVRPDTTLLVAGDGPLMNDTQKLAQELSIVDQVRFLGRRQDVPQLMNAADAFVLGSEYEGLPLVLLEAAAVGLPIAATDVGGNPEVVYDGLTGTLAAPNSPDTLARAMASIMAMTTEQRREMGAAGRKLVSAQYGMQQVVTVWENIYSHLLNKAQVADLRHICPLASH
jgi:glycosyltransferase involved in cell wall biosynthesis